VRIAAAEALGRYGTGADLTQALAELVELASIDRKGVFVAMAALNAIDMLGVKAAPMAADLKRLPDQGKVPHPRYAGYVPRLLTDIRANFK
jgi:hypothetical protein